MTDKQYDPYSFANLAQEQFTNMAKEAYENAVNFHLTNASRMVSIMEQYAAAQFKFWLTVTSPYTNVGKSE